MEELDETKEDYNDKLKEIGGSLTARQRELDNILSGRNRLASLYTAHHEQLQISANSLSTKFLKYSENTLLPWAFRAYCSWPFETIRVNELSQKLLMFAKILKKKRKTKKQNFRDRGCCV